MKIYIKMSMLVEMKLKLGIRKGMRRCILQEKGIIHMKENVNLSYIIF